MRLPVRAVLHTRHDATVCDVELEGSTWLILTSTLDVGSLEIDTAVYAELEGSGAFDKMTQDVDEAEHSLELHMPYVVHVLR